MTKYWSKKIEVDWIIFDSQIEWKFYWIINSEETKKFLNISKIELQKVYILQEPFILEDHIEVKRKKLTEKVWRSKYEYYIVKGIKKYKEIKYIADFILTINWKEYVIDIKWFETPDFKLKKKMFENKFKVPIICVNSPVITNWMFIDFLKEETTIN